MIKGQFGIGDVKWQVWFIDRRYFMNEQSIEIWGHCEKCVAWTFRRLYPEQEFRLNRMHQA